MADLDDELRALLKQLKLDGVLLYRDVEDVLAFGLIPDAAITIEGHKILIDHQGVQGELRPVKGPRGWAWELQAPGIWTACDTAEQLLEALDEVWPPPPVELDDLTDEDRALLEKVLEGMGMEEGGDGDA